MANEGRPEDTEFMTRAEREEAGRRVNAGFAQYERYEHTESGQDASSEIPTGPIVQKLSEEEIRRRVGEGNFDAAKNDGQSPSINS